MPELPEVETVVRGLRDTIVGLTIDRVLMNAPPSTTEISSSFGQKSFSQILKNRSVQSIDRRGKNILISLSGDITLWAHLKMTGRFLWLPDDTPIAKHDLMSITFSNKSCKHVLRFNDYRRFGRLRLYPNDELWQQKGLASLGPEPLEMPAVDFIALCHRRPRMIKPALMDQSFIVGVGNIYADESLHLSRLHPARPTTSVSKRKLIELHGHIQSLLKKAISLAGTSVDSYQGVNGKPGTFQNYLRAYGREGEDCLSCGRTMIRIKLGSRSACLCPRCQKA